MPGTTGAATATAKAVPAIEDRLDGVALRVPVPVGSIADVVSVTSRETTEDEVNGIFREETESDRYRDVLGISEDQIVSTNIVADPRASIGDLTLTTVTDGDLVKIMAWYDDEWGYARQMVRCALTMVGELAAVG